MKMLTLVEAAPNWVVHWRMPELLNFVTKPSLAAPLDPEFREKVSPNRVVLVLDPHTTSPMA